ncbi:hypothetical protein D3C80_1308650 [compost metagenome]
MVELLFSGFAEAGVNADTGVIDQIIEAGLVEHTLQGPRHFPGEFVEGVAAADIQLQHGCSYLGFFQGLDQFLGFVGLAVVGADDIDAMGGQVLRRVLAQPSAGAGDKCDFANHCLILVP